VRVHSAPQADQPLRLATRREVVRSRLSAEWLLDGAGFGWLRFAVDLIMLGLAVVAVLAAAFGAVQLAELPALSSAGTVERRTCRHGGGGWPTPLGAR